MNQRLFQDAGGTTPAIIAGQPVGLIKRLAGSVDAMQDTALSKPTLARHPKSGIRMIQRRNVFDSLPLGVQTANNQVSGFGTSLSGDGVSVEVLERGYEGGLPYAIIRVYGVHSGGATKFINVGNFDNIAVTEQRVSVRALLTLISGSLSQSDAGMGMRLYANFRYQGASVNGVNADFLNVTGEEKLFSGSVRPQADAPVDESSSRGVYFRIASGAAVDATVKIKAVQVEQGAIMSAFQTVYSPNDITETGVPDLWHLYNDGGDSLNVTLPAGIYGLASIDINRAITITTITSDAITPINTLRHERQLDVILRAGAFSAGEETAIRDYWGRVFA